MPRNVRNFWVVLTAGNREPCSFGPRQAADGMTIVLYVRDAGKVREGAVRIDCQVDEGSGKLRVIADRGDGSDPVVLAETER